MLKIAITESAAVVFKVLVWIKLHLMVQIYIFLEGFLL